MYLPIKVQDVLMNKIVSAIESDRSMSSSGTLDYNSPCNNQFFSIDDDTWFVVYCPNATDDEGGEHFNMIALEIIKYDEPLYVNNQIKHIHELRDELDSILGAIDVELSEESESTCEGETCRKVLPSSMLNNGLCWDCGCDD